MTHHETYHERLLKAFEGNVEGYAFFSALARATQVADERRKLHFLAGLETRTSQLLAPLIERYNLTPRPTLDLTAKGVQEAETYQGLTWVQLNERFALEFPRAVEEFLATEALAPEAELRICKLVTAHEIALVNFAKEEVEGTDFGMVHLQNYFALLAKYHADLLAPPIVADHTAYS